MDNFMVMDCLTRKQKVKDLEKVIGEFHSLGVPVKDTSFNEEDNCYEFFIRGDLFQLKYKVFFFDELNYGKGRKVYVPYIDNHKTAVALDDCIRLAKNLNEARTICELPDAGFDVMIDIKFNDVEFPFVIGNREDRELFVRCSYDTVDGRNDKEFYDKESISFVQDYCLRRTTKNLLLYYFRTKIQEYNEAYKKAMEKVDEKAP